MNQTFFYDKINKKEDTRGFIYTDKMEFHVIELPKLSRELSEGCSRLELWAKFINSEKKEEFEMLAEKDHSISSAFQRLQIMIFKTGYSGNIIFNTGLWTGNAAG